MELWDVYDKKGRKTGARRRRKLTICLGNTTWLWRLGYLTAAGKF